MHTVDKLDRAKGMARQRGYRIREEWLSGAGGACVIRGEKWLFLDLGSSPAEQLELVQEALREEAADANAAARLSATSESGAERKICRFAP